MFSFFKKKPEIIETPKTIVLKDTVSNRNAEQLANRKGYLGDRLCGEIF